MNDWNKSQLEAAGVHVEEVLARFMNNEGLMMRFLIRFPQDPNYRQLCLAIEAGNHSDAFVAAHTLKGVAGNLAMTHLFREISQVVELLRAGEMDQARERMPVVDAEYRRTVQGLEPFMEQV